MYARLYTYQMSGCVGHTCSSPQPCKWRWLLLPNSGQGHGVLTQGEHVEEAPEALCEQCVWLSLHAAQAAEFPQILLRVEAALVKLSVREGSRSGHPAGSKVCARSSCRTQRSPPVLSVFPPSCVLCSGHASAPEQCPLPHSIAAPSLTLPVVTLCGSLP